MLTKHLSINNRIIVGLIATPGSNFLQSIIQKPDRNSQSDARGATSALQLKPLGILATDHYQIDALTLADLVRIAQISNVFDFGLTLPSSCSPQCRDHNTRCRPQVSSA